MLNAVLAPPDPVALDDFTELAARTLKVPVACVSLVDAHRRLVTSSYGLCVPIALLVSWSFFDHLGSSDRPLIVSDGRVDPVLARNPAVRERTVRAYMGMRLLTSDGRAVGTLCVMDRKPRRWSSGQIAFLKGLCTRIVDEMEPAGLEA